MNSEEVSGALDRMDERMDDEAPDPIPDAVLAIEAERKAIVIAFIDKCRELRVGFGDDVLMRQRLEALIEVLFGNIDHDDDGNLTVGDEKRVIFELEVARRMLNLANTRGVEAALTPDSGKLVVPQTVMPNRAMRRGQPGRGR